MSHPHEQRLLCGHHKHLKPRRRVCRDGREADARDVVHRGPAALKGLRRELRLGRQCHCHGRHLEGAEAIVGVQILLHLPGALVLRAARPGDGDFHVALSTKEENIPKPKPVERSIGDRRASRGCGVELEPVDRAGCGRGELRDPQPVRPICIRCSGQRGPSPCALARVE